VIAEFIEEPIPQRNRNSMSFKKSPVTHLDHIEDFFINIIDIIRV